jgi:hypothetical protein
MSAASVVMSYAPDAPAAAVVFFDGSQLAGGKGRLMVNGDINLLQQQTGGFATFSITDPAGVDVTRLFLNILGGHIEPSGCAAVPIAHPDTFTTAPGAASPSVLGNDFYDEPNGVAATAGNSAITPLGPFPAGIVLRPDGTISVDASVPLGSSYTLYYQLCKVSDPTVCSPSATITLTVAKAIVVTGPSTPVPTLSWWGLAMLAALLASMGLRRKSG